MFYYKSSNNDEGHFLQVFVPGYGKEDLEVELEGTSLVIKSKDFERVFIVPENADVENVSAQCKNGILEVRFPKNSVRKKIKVA